MNAHLKAYTLIILALSLLFSGLAWADETDLTWSTLLGGGDYEKFCAIYLNLRHENTLVFLPDKKKNGGISFVSNPWLNRPAILGGNVAEFSRFCKEEISSVFVF